MTPEKLFMLEVTAGPEKLWWFKTLITSPSEYIELRAGSETTESSLRRSL